MLVAEGMPLCWYSVGEKLGHSLECDEWETLGTEERVGLLVLAAKLGTGESVGLLLASATKLGVGALVPL